MLDLYLGIMVTRGRVSIAFAWLSTRLNIRERCTARPVFNFVQFSFGPIIIILEIVILTGEFRFELKCIRLKGNTRPKCSTSTRRDSMNASKCRAFRQKMSNKWDAEFGSRPSNLN